MNAESPRRDAQRAVDDPVILQRAARLVRAALARQRAEKPPAEPTRAGLAAEGGGAG